MITSIYLYSTSHCHLCELAHALAFQLSKEYNLKEIEIADDEYLLARYSLKIPVLQRQDTLEELNWPFDEVKIKDFLR